MDLWRCLLILGLAGAAASTDSVSCPQWPKTYNVTGFLRLPYAEVNEPFTGYFDGSANKSRVDYYDSSVVTIQLGKSSKEKFGESYKIAPVFMKQKNAKMCFLVKGTSDAPVRPQSLLPDLTGFKLIGKEEMLGKSCEMYRMITKEGNKTNTYTMWMTAKGAPVRYEMMGFDSLLGSHYDKYYVDYTSMVGGKIPSNVFTVPKGLQCGDFPGPGSSDHHHLSMNPMAEFINRDDSATDNGFDHFKKAHNKHYKDDKEHTQRKHVFRQNLRYIHSNNRAGLTYSLAVNHLADLTDAERAVMRGYRHSFVHDPNAIPFDRSLYDVSALPENLDWRLYGAVTPVKDQSACGSCWSFGTAEALEGAYYVKTGQLLRLSPQELMDCSWDEGNNGCDGGEDFRAYRWILQNGLARDDAYGPYLSQDGICHYKNVSEADRVRMTGYVNVSTGNRDDLKLALYKNGPVSVAIDASLKSFSFYSNGVYYDKDCGNKPEDLDHAVLAVGYGKINGMQYWLIKNSWSTYWGNDGYVLISQTYNNCGVETSPTYVTM